MQNIEDRIIKLLSSPKTAAHRKQVRAFICKQIKNLLNQRAEHGDRKSLHNFIKSKGYEISTTNYDRILATETEINQQADERTAFIVLRHAASFFGSDITPQLEELYRVLDTPIPVIV